MAARAVKVQCGEKLKIQQLLQEMSHLKIKIQSIEKDLGPLIFLRKSMAGYVYSELRENEVQLTVSRKAEENEIRQNLKKIRSKVSNFSKNVNAPRCPSPETVHRLKEVMEDIEMSITDMKGNQANTYKELLRDEKSLCSEIQALGKRFESWENQNTTFAHSVIHPKIPAANDMPREVSDFESFVAASGGHNGEWDGFDHSTYMRILCTHKGHPTMKQYLAGLPTKTEEEVLKHIGWYVEYQSLLSKKKEAIQKWRQVKDFEKKILTDEAVKRLAEREEGKENAEKMSNLRTEMQNTKTQIQRWKLGKEFERVEQEKLLQHEKEERLIAEEKKRSQQRAFMEEIRVRKVHLKAMMEDHSKDLMSTMKDKLAEAKRQETMRMTIARFQERDQLALQKKMDQVRAREQEKDDREARLINLIGQQNFADVKRDPDRLLKPTQGWIERQKAKTTEAGDGGPLLHMPHRAIPTWRQDLY